MPDMKKFLRILVLALVAAGIFYFPKLERFLRGVRPAIFPPPVDIAGPSFNDTGLPLALPPGFSISVFARDLPGARVLLLDKQGNMWVSQTREGAVSLLEIKEGKVTDQKPVFQNLNNPHGLAFDPDNSNVLYIAEEHRISKVDLKGETKLQKIADLPSGGGHFTRTLGFGPDGRLYVAIGSSCNVCLEGDFRRAKIFSLNRDGSDFREYARGLRNTVFFIWDKSGRMWGTDMGRDHLGDDLPPDEINLIEAGHDYGWPHCYGKNVPDPFGGGCEGKTGSHIEMQAHSAPLGLAFYEGDLLVAFHGSWNRSIATGYKIVRMKLDEEGNFRGSEDFIIGWLAPGGGALGRPVDILPAPGGVLYISDDKAGVIYRLRSIRT